ncbi:DUF397 domain-containing protein [Actinomadura atramentaria]|uniref:DUF397 domain-containing protein n=1 Tax=Actinomadura atramentaria TaxID=1990 RepID=UPI00037AB361|nr:DUF397 domain-containing protein [Actinomadura atramentaria]
MDLTHVTWRKATRSGDNGGNCIEVASVPETIAVRDSKDPEGPRLLLPRDEFRTFAAVVRNL